MEIWDLYDENRNLIGEHIRGVEMPDNGYHLVVHVWLKNKKGQFIITQRSADRELHPLKWEASGGSVLKGENTLQAAIREVKEEIGVDLQPENAHLLFTELRKVINGRKFNDILDVWLFDYDGEPCLDKATTNEVAAARWMDKAEIKKLYDEKKLMPTLSYFFDIF